MPRAKTKQDAASEEKMGSSEVPPPETGRPKSETQLPPPPNTGPQPEPPKRNFIDTLEEWANRIVAAIKYDRMRIWKEVLFHPTATLSEQMQPGIPSLKRGAKDIFVASLPSLLIGLVVLAIIFLYALLIGALATIATLGVGAIFLVGLVIGMVLILILYFLGPIISWLIMSAIQYILARLLGGKSDFTTQAYLMALGMSGCGVVRFIVLLLSYIPCLGWIFQPIAALVSIYSLYLNYKAVRTAHGLSRNRAIAVVLIPILFWVALIVLLVIGFYAGIFSLALLGSAIKRP